MAAVLSEKAKEKMAEWHLAKPVFAIMGEYSSGKSTLLNFLIGQDVAPTKVTATHLPSIWITYSNKPYCAGIRADGTEIPVDLATTQENLREAFVLIRVGIKAEQLKRCDIIDTPGISDPTLPKGALRFLTKYLDFVIWCSAANQAWRQTEKAAWMKIAKPVRDNSILLLTRVDKLRNESEESKVLKRVRKDTDGLFHSVLPLKTTKAAAVSIDMRDNDPDGLWAQTGGLVFTQELNNALETASEKCANRKEKLKSQTPSQPRKTTQSKPLKGTENPVEKAYEELASKITKWTQNERVTERLGAVKDNLADIETKVDSHLSTIVACLTVGDETDLDLERMMTQIERDIRYFSTQEWVRLDV